MSTKNVHILSSSLLSMNSFVQEEKYHFRIESSSWKKYSVNFVRQLMPGEQILNMGFNHILLQRTKKKKKKKYQELEKSVFEILVPSRS